MGTYVDCTITITKGDPKEVLDVVRTNESVIDLRTIGTRKHMRYPEFFDPESAMFDGEYSTQDNFVVIKFWVKNWTPDAIFDDLAERFPEHEFAVVRGVEHNGEDELLLKNGQCKLARSRWWEWSEKRQQPTAVRDMKWDWDGTEQEGSFDIRREFLREEQEWYDQQRPESVLARKGGTDSAEKSESRRHNHGEVRKQVNEGETTI